MYKTIDLTDEEAAVLLKVVYAAKKIELDDSQLAILSSITSKLELVNIE